MNTVGLKKKRVSMREQRGLLAALATAAEQGAEAVAEALRSVEWARKDDCDKTLALAYAKANRAAELRRLLSQRSDWAALLSSERLLVAAAKEGAGESMAALIEVGLSPDDKSGYFEFPLLVAAMNGKPASCIKVLAEHGADMDWRNKSGWSALGWVAYYKNHERDGKWKMAKALLAAGADPNARGGGEKGYSNEWAGGSPLMLACQSNHEKISKILERGGAKFDAVDGEGRSALMWACKSGGLACVKLLLGWGCDVEKVDANGMGAESWARQYGHEDCARAVAVERSRRQKAELGASIGRGRSACRAGRSRSI